jgi:aspartate-semialdehyde dehydrogenase
MSAHFARQQRHEALDRLSDRRLYRELAYVGGHWTASATASSFEVTDPASGASLAFVAALDESQTTDAISAERKRFPHGARCCRRSAPACCATGMNRSSPPEKTSPS